MLFRTQKYKYYLEKAFPSGIESIVAPDYTKLLKENITETRSESSSTIPTFYQASAPFLTVVVKPQKALEFFYFLINDENSKFTELCEWGNNGEDLTLDEFKVLLNEDREFETFFILYSPTFGMVIRVETKVTGTILDIIEYWFDSNLPEKTSSKYFLNSPLILLIVFINLIFLLWWGLG